MHRTHFTAEVRAALSCARQEAARLSYGYVAADHLLLGLLLAGDTAVLDVLAASGVDPAELKAAVEAGMPASTEPPSGPDVPYTTRAKRVIELALGEARERKQLRVGTEHLLVGIVREGRSVAAQALRERGVDADSFRAALGPESADPPTHPRSVMRRSTGYNFSERVRKVLAMAREEAGRLRHNYVGTEHILLGILREGEGVGCAALRNMGADPLALISVVERTVRPGDASDPSRTDFAYTPRAKKVLEEAMAESAGLQHGHVGTEHLLLGLMREERGIAAVLLNDAGLRTDALRAEVLRLLGPARPADDDDDDSPHLHTDVDPGHYRQTRKGAVREARLRLVETQAAATDEERMWSRLRNALELCESLGTTPGLTRRPDGSVEVRVTEQLSIVIPRLPGLEVREGNPPAGG